MQRIFPGMLLVFLFLSIPSFLKGQLITFEGQIIDAREQTGVPFAWLEINGRGDYADESGHFTLEVPEADHYQGVVTQLGYERRELTFAGAEELPATLSLKAEPVLLSEILVTDRPQGLIPRSTILQDKAKELDQPRDVGEWLRGVPGFGLVRRGGYALDPVFRSFKYEQINLVYDGGIQATHACPARMDPASTHVNPDEIEKLELIKGPFSVRYGPTVGGILNIVTQSPLRAPAGVGGFVETGYETNGDGRQLRAGLEGGQGPWRFSAAAGYKTFDDYLSGAGREVPSGFRVADYALRSTLSTADRQQWSVSWRQSFARDIDHAGLMMDTEEDNTSMLSLDYQWRQTGEVFNGLTAKVYGTRVDHVMTNGNRPNFAMVEAVAPVQANTLGGKVEARWMPGRRQVWHTGMDYRYVGRSGERERLIRRNMMTGEELPAPMLKTDPIWQDASLHDLGLFAEGSLLLSDRWTLVTGMRLDWVAARIGDPAVSFEQLYDRLETTGEVNLSGHLSVNYELPRSWAFQAALGRGVRTANMIERYINHFTVGMDAYEYVGNPQLKPEANHQLELSAARTEGPLRGEISLFGSYVTNYITAAVDSTLPRLYMPATPPAFARRFRNVDAVQAGAEMSLEAALRRHLTGYGNLSYTRTRNLDWEEPLAEIPPLSATLGLRWDDGVFYLDGAWRLVDQQERVSVAFGEQSTPGFTVVDLRAGWRPLAGLTVGGTVRNLLDRHYYEHLNRGFRNLPEAGRIYEPGRNVTFFLKYDF